MVRAAEVLQNEQWVAMPRYVTRASDGWIDEGRTAREIIVEDIEPKFSGLYDATGQKLYRADERIPVGFAPRHLK